MFGVLIGFVIFMIGIPVKTAILGLKTAQKVHARKTGTDKKSKLKKRLGFKTKNQGKDTAGNKMLQTTLKATIRGLKVLLLFLKVLSYVITVIWSVITMLLASGTFILLAAIAGVVILSKDIIGEDLLSDDGYTSGYISGQIAGENGNEGGTGEWANVSANGDLVEAIKITGNWFLSNLRGIYVNDANVSFECDLLSGADGTARVRADCTGFVQAVLRLFFDDKGVNFGHIPASGSKDMYNPNSSWGQWAISHGFQYINVVQTGFTADDLIAGDLVIIYRPEVNRNHAVFYLSPTERMDWGSDKVDSCPRKSTWSTITSGAYAGMLKSYASETGGYEVVWRYVGNAQ